ncbi:MAG: 5'-methylthioadenosine/adenosylhomocysteine nucleosidase [Treponema sp.]|nr:5'-methylthioadenosine/adenosylhomocysteine nucleosidase [Treponema sp.]
MKKFGIIGAMEKEVAYLKKLAGDTAVVKKVGHQDFVEGEICGTPVVIVKSGVGKVNAALCAQRLILQFGVTHVINTGIAGAVAKGLGVLDFVVSTDAMYHDMDATAWGYAPAQIPQMDVSQFPADEALIQAALAVFTDGDNEELFGGHKLISGRVASGDQFIGDTAKKQHIIEVCNPACVEMEGAAIAHACFLNNTPFVILRCMSDCADENGKSDADFSEDTAAEMSAKLVVGLLERL